MAEQWSRERRIHEKKSNPAFFYRQAPLPFHAAKNAGFIDFFNEFFFPHFSLTSF